MGRCEEPAVGIGSGRAPRSGGLDVGEGPRLVRLRVSQGDYSCCIGRRPLVSIKLKKKDLSRFWVVLSEQFWG